MNTRPTDTASAPATPKTKARLEALITGWREDSGQPVARLNLRIAAMMLAGGKENLRYWDLIDLQMLEALAGEDLTPVEDACTRTFAARDQQPWPPHITIYPSWIDRYAAMAKSLDMPITDVNQAVEIVHAFIKRIDAH